MKIKKEKKEKFHIATNIDLRILEIIDQKAKKQKRSRSSQVATILEDWAEKENINLS